MPHRHCSHVLVALALGGCSDDPSSAIGDDSSSSAAASDDTDAVTTAATSDGSGSDGPAIEGSSGDGSSSEAGTTAGADGYPPEVTDALDLPWPPDDYAQPDLPQHYLAAAVDALDNTPVGNAITDEGATLGRVLFHDTTLSKNHTIACASCHEQEHGFADDAALSTGFAGGLTGRNSMSAADARYYADGRFFWDERAATLEDQVLMPIQNEIEMGLTRDELVERVADAPYYPPLFERAFGDAEITEQRIALALAQYVRATLSYRTRYDDQLAQTGSILGEFPGYSAQENLGKQLFLVRGCARCHLGNLGPPPPPGMPPGNQAVFSLVVAANNGLDLETSDDPGVMTATGDPTDDGKFKSPSLRNVAVTGPYMHDGRFATLLEVVEHYDSGVQPHPNLDPRLQDPDGAPLVLDLTELEKLALVAFLETLTDEALLADPKFANPFR